MHSGKIIIISAPSGSGKSTIIHSIIANSEYHLEFSISATTRPPRLGEANGVDYYFLSEEDFRNAIKQNKFAEYEEVYPGRFYGTLKSEFDRIMNKGHNVIIDVDVKGAQNIKALYGDRALSLFIMPPSIETLRHRLLSRGTDAVEEINKRVAKAEYELGFAEQFDYRIVNDVLKQAEKETHSIIANFLDNGKD